MNADRIKEIQQKTAYPESISVYKALLQVWNECEQNQLTHPEPMEDADVLQWLDDNYSDAYNECDGFGDVKFLSRGMVKEALIEFAKTRNETPPKLGAEELFEEVGKTVIEEIDKRMTHWSGTYGLLQIDVPIAIAEAMKICMEQYASQQGDGWVSVEDRLPDNIKIKDDEPDELKLILDTDEIVNGFYADGTWWLELGGNNVGHHDIRSLSVEVEVLYWKKLPKPPKSNE